MLLHSVEAERFLSFGDRMRLDVGPGLTVVTGPNGVGKTNLGACLDLGRVIVARAAGVSGTDQDRVALYEGAGYFGAPSYRVAIDLELDQERERALVRAFACAAYACSPAEGGGSSADEDDVLVRQWLVGESLAPFYSGALIVHYDSAMMRPWFAAWEFGNADGTWHVVLEGDGSGQLRRGPAQPGIKPSGAGSVRDWLLESKPQAETRLDVEVALDRMSQPVSFSVQPLTGGPGRIPASLLELAPLMSPGERGNRGFSFAFVLWSVLRRGLVMTDNRRLPLRRRFSYEEVWEPADLRDGADTAAELYRLKSGAAENRELFRQVQATFKSLTGKVIEVRANAAPIAGNQESGMIIEPVIVDARGERPLEFAGAGVQEAALLSILVADLDGKVLILDEPAVNLEATAQRRLLRSLRGPGQCVVITHHADLVPVEEPADLTRIVRIAPGPSGAQVLRPDLGNLSALESQRWLRLLEPVHVRALLFASAVIFCEGMTELKALPPWWRHARRIGLRDPEAANVPVIGVDGDTSFGAYARYLEAFAIPWAIVVDGPALQDGSAMASQLAALGRHPSALPEDLDDFSARRAGWEEAGVFTLARTFGGDDKGGEFEAFLEDVDETILARVRKEAGRGKKPVVASLFVAEHPEPPAEVLDLYRKIGAWLGPDLIPYEGIQG